MIICADDYGLTDDINRAILELVVARKLSAISCMVVLKRCSPESLRELLAYETVVDVGLHLCLTDEGLPLAELATGRSSAKSFPKYKTVAQQALLGKIRPQEMEPLIAEQYQLFIEKCGRRPDFIDGHLHTHQLPGVREGLLKFILSLPTNERPYIRNTRMPIWKIFCKRLPWLKAYFIGVFGQRMWKDLHQSGLRTNEGFSGIYDFKNWPTYRKLLPKFAECLPHPNGILVTHPGHEEEWRREEFKTLQEISFTGGSPNRFQAEV